MKNGKMFGPPRLIVSDEGGREVFSHRFSASGWDSLQSHVWKAPPELAGKSLEARLEVEKAPFEILTPPQTIIP
jgi:hypothetical protein